MVVQEVAGVASLTIWILPNALIRSLPSSTMSATSVTQTPKQDFNTRLHKARHPAFSSRHAVASGFLRKSGPPKLFLSLAPTLAKYDGGEST